MLRYSGSGRSTLVVEKLGESHPDCVDILCCDTEGGGGKTNLLDEVSDLILVKAHEPSCMSVAGDECDGSIYSSLMNSILAAVAAVGGEAVGAGFGAAKKDTKVLV